MIDLEKCFTGQQVVTAEEFAKLPPRSKGYVVYMLGERADQPNVPRRFRPPAGDAEEFKKGEQLAILEAQDMED